MNETNQNANEELREAFLVLERQSTFLGTNEDVLLTRLRRMITTEARTVVPHIYSELAQTRLNHAVEVAELVQVMNPQEKSRIANARSVFQRLSAIPLVDPRPVDSVINQAAKILPGRSKQYGPPSESCRLIAEFFSVVLQHEVNPKLVPLMMIGMKVARHMVGGSTDDLVDICGYAEVAHEVEKTESTSTPTDRAVPGSP